MKRPKTNHQVFVQLLFNTSTSHTMTSTGYELRTNRLYFNGDENIYDLWEVKFIAYLRTQKLHNVLDADDQVDANKNADLYAELVQVLDDRSLSLVMREAKNNGRKAFQILRDHYKPKGKPRIISLYTQLTSLSKGDENLTDYIIRAETAASSLRDAGETVSDGLLIAMVIKGLPAEYKPFTTVVTQSATQQSFQDFKVSLRNYEDTQGTHRPETAVMNLSHSTQKHQHQNSKHKHSTRSSKNRWCTVCKQDSHDTRYCRRLSTGNHVKPRYCDVCQTTSHDTRFCRKLSKVREVKIDNNEAASDEQREHHFAFIISDGTSNENSFLVDSGASVHIVCDESKFVKFHKHFDSNGHVIELADGTRLGNLATAQGDARFKIRDIDGNEQDVILNNCLYVPSFRQNIFSVRAATEAGASILFKENCASLRHKGKTFNVNKKGQLYYLNVCQTKKNEASHTLQKWHEILGHCNFQDVQHLEKVVEGMNIISDKQNGNKDCDVCIQSKMTERRSRIPDKKATRVLDLVHMDLAGPIDPVAHDGFRYALCCVDDFSGLTMVYFLKEKSDTSHAFEKYLADITPYGTVKRIRTDNGGEFISKQFDLIVIKNKIKHEKSAPHSPHQNGTVERAWRTLFEMARCLLSQSGLSKTMWTYAVMASAYTRNRCYNPRTKCTPFESFTGSKPNISHMQTFGCSCYALVQNPKKLDPRSEPGIFVGYDKGSPAYLVYFPKTATVKRVRCVEFLNKTQGEKQNLTMPVQMNSNEDDEEEFFGKRTRDHNISEEKEPEPEKQNLTMPVQIGSNEDYEEEFLNRRTRDHNVIEEKQSEPEKRNPVTGTERSKRNRSRPKHLEDYHVDDEIDEHLNRITLHYCYSMSVPTTHGEAMTSKDAKKWQKAMDDEMSALRENETFELTTLPTGRQAVGGKWVYTVKSGPNDEKQYKARFVAKGYSQIRDIDYHETFSPTARMSSVRTLAQLSVQNDWVVHQMDVRAAYLNAEIDVEIYVEQPQGYEVKTESNEKLVWRLKKSLYGLKQSGRNWNAKFNAHLIEQGFVQSEVDPCVYIKHCKSSSDQTDEHAIILIWVDDVIIATKSTPLLNNVKARLSLTFNMKDLGALSWFLGIQFSFTNEAITMSQTQYIKKLLSKFGMEECKPRFTPCDVNLNKFCDEEADPADENLYKEIVGSLIYVMTATRPDLCYIVTRLSQYMTRPTKNHMIAAKHALRYLKATMNQGITYRKSGNTLKLVGACDADWGNCADRKSITGYTFMLSNDGPSISWKSKKQQTVALSTCEAEYMAMCAATQEGLYLNALLKDMLCAEQGAFTLYCDNQGTLAMSKNPIVQQRSKHIDIKYHFVRHHVQNGNVSVIYLPTTENFADLFTKPMGRQKMLMFTPILMG